MQASTALNAGNSQMDKRQKPTAKAGIQAREGQWNC